MKSNICLYLYVSILLVSCSSPKKSEKADRQIVETKEQEQTTNLKTILFFGNSITAGYQLDLSEAFSALIQNRLDSLNIAYRTVNAGLSGETTASGATRVDWVLKNPIEIFVLELGANDGLRGIKTLETKKNLQHIIDKVFAKYPECQIILAGMKIPPNMGQVYTKDFEMIYPELAKENDIQLIPFLLDGVAGIPELNLEDGIHPTAEGHSILMENVWKVLSPLLEK
ncbi:MAG: arylesterase [Reichenbachiella sp.]